MNISVDHYIAASDIPVGNYTISDEELNKLLALEAYVSKHQNFDSWDAEAVQKLLKNTKKVQQLADQYRIDDAQKRTLVNEHLKAGGFKKARLGRKLKFSKSLYLVAKRKRNQWEQEAQEKISEEREKLEKQLDDLKPKLEQCNQKIQELKKEWDDKLSKAEKIINLYDEISRSLPQYLQPQDYKGNRKNAWGHYMPWQQFIVGIFGKDTPYIQLGEAYEQYQELMDKMNSVTSDADVEVLQSLIENVSAFSDMILSEEKLKKHLWWAGSDLNGLQGYEQAVYDDLQKLVEELRGKISECQNSDDKAKLKNAIKQLTPDLNEDIDILKPLANSDDRLRTAFQDGVSQSENSANASLEQFAESEESSDAF